MERGHDKDSVEYRDLTVFRLHIPFAILLLRYACTHDFNYTTLRELGVRVEVVQIKLLLHAHTTVS